MPYFAIIETDDGLTIVELKPREKAQDAAITHGGVLIDPGPYTSYDDANDAMIALQREEEEEG